MAQQRLQQHNALKKIVALITRGANAVTMLNTVAAWALALKTHVNNLVKMQRAGMLIARGAEVGTMLNGLEVWVHAYRQFKSIIDSAPQHVVQCKITGVVEMFDKTQFAENCSGYAPELIHCAITSVAKSKSKRSLYLTLEIAGPHAAMQKLTLAPKIGSYKLTVIFIADKKAIQIEQNNMVLQALISGYWVRSCIRKGLPITNLF